MRDSRRSIRAISLRAVRRSAAETVGRAAAALAGPGVQRRTTPSPSRGPAQVQVLLDAAGQLAQQAVAQQRHLRVAHALEQVAVVRDDDQRARPAVEQVLERGQRVGVEVVGRLVEQQHVGLADEQPQQLQPAALAARQVAHGGPGRARGRSRAARPAGRRSAPCRRRRPSASRSRSPRSRAGRPARRGPRRPGVSSATCTVLPRLTRPVVGCCRPDRSRSSEVLPAPLTPTRPTRSPGPSRQVMSCSSTRSP